MTDNVKYVTAQMVMEIDQRVRSPSRRARAIIKELQKAEGNHSNWDLICFCVEYLAHSVPVLPHLGSEIRHISKQIYLQHYIQYNNPDFDADSIRAPLPFGGEPETGQDARQAGQKSQAIPKEGPTKESLREQDAQATRETRDTELSKLDEGHSKNVRRRATVRLIETPRRRKKDE